MTFLRARPFGQIQYALIPTDLLDHFALAVVSKMPEFPQSPQSGISKPSSSFIALTTNSSQRFFTLDMIWLRGSCCTRHEQGYEPCLGTKTTLPAINC